MQIVTLSIRKTNKFDLGIRGFQVKYAPGFTSSRNSKATHFFCYCLYLDPELSFFRGQMIASCGVQQKKTRLMTVMLDTKPLIVKMYYMTSYRGASFKKIAF